MTSCGVGSLDAMSKNTVLQASMHRLEHMIDKECICSTQYNLLGNAECILGGFLEYLPDPGVVVVC